ncbi:MAG: hypothetical protein IKP89_02830, partial [Bacteroidales bacterium]|nr:hypothetical protein [Bacteroidales bacterium]
PEWTSANGRTTLRIYSKREEHVTNDRIRTFLAAKKKGEIFTKADYMSFFEKNVSRITALNDLQVMLQLRLCEKMGQGPRTRYKLV